METTKTGTGCGSVPETLVEALDHKLRQCGHFVYHHSAGVRQRRVLALLGEHGSMSQKDIQEAMDVRAGTMSEMISKLEHKGLVERTRDEEDRRRVTISLTPSGEKLSRADTRVQLETRYRVLNEEERAQLLDLLGRLLVSWEE